jgi:hypothetical protein
MPAGARQPHKSERCAAALTTQSIAASCVRPTDSHLAIAHASRDTRLNGPALIRNLQIGVLAGPFLN